MFNEPPIYSNYISILFQTISFFICAPLVWRLVIFYISSCRIEMKKNKSIVWPALGLGYAVISSFLIIANIWLMPNFSICVLGVLPILQPAKLYFIYFTHSLVISAFVVNYANSVETLQELELGRYGGKTDWGMLMRSTSLHTQALDAGARLGIGVMFVWLEHNLWRTGQVDLAKMTFDFAVDGSQVDVVRYRGLLADVADAAFSVYAALTLWITVTIGAMLGKNNEHFNDDQARSLVWRQIRIISFGFCISTYTIYIARGQLSLYNGETVPEEIDSDWIFSFALTAALMGGGLLFIIAERVLGFFQNGEILGGDIQAE